MTKKSCVIQKTCCVCGRERHNTEFESNAKGRTALKPHCNHCKEIYDGIRDGRIQEEHYIGLDYNTNQLKADNYGFVLYLKKGQFEKITLDLAIRLVKQGMAHVTSSSTIEVILHNDLPTSVKGDIHQKLREYVMKRDDKKCHYCVRPGTTLDHIIPRFEGGLNTPLNLVACCKECNELKSNMSRDKFIRHLKSGSYNYFTRSWKPEVKLETSEKKCKTCQEIKKTTDFSPQEVNCKKCEKLHNVVQLGLINKEKIKNIKLNYSLLKHAHIKLIGFEQEEIGWVNKDHAEELLNKGLISTVDKNVIQFILDNKSIKRVYPKFVLNLVTPTKPKPKPVLVPKVSESVTSTDRMNQISKMLNAEKVEIQDFDKKKLGHVTKYQALHMFQQGIVTVVTDNVVRIGFDEANLKKRYPDFKLKTWEEQFGMTVPSTSTKQKITEVIEETPKIVANTVPVVEKHTAMDNVKGIAKEFSLLTKTTVNCVTSDNQVLKNVRTRSLKELFESGMATAKVKNEAIIKADLEQLVENYPHFIKYCDAKNQEQLLFGTVIAIYDKNDDIWANVPNKIGKKLLKLGLGEIEKANRIKLTDDVYFVKAKLPQVNDYILYKEEGKVVLSAWTVKVQDDDSNVVTKMKLKEALNMAENNEVKVIDSNKVQVKETMKV